MPLTYGGGIANLENAKQIFDLGFEKIVYAKILNNEIIIKSSNEFPCSYIEGRTEKRIFLNIPYKSKIREKVVSELTRKGFRRNYNHMYIPTCKSCSSCISLRININNFMLSKSNKRNLKVNDDLFLIDNKI